MRVSVNGGKYSCIINLLMYYYTYVHVYMYAYLYAHTCARTSTNKSQSHARCGLKITRRHVCNGPLRDQVYCDFRFIIDQARARKGGSESPFGEIQVYVYTRVTHWVVIFFLIFFTVFYFVFQPQ